jgi:uncharacterized protein YaiI (UPF0178 family)
VVAIYIDADACPVKGEVYKVAGRYGLRVHVVANGGMSVPDRPWIELVTVRGDFNAADDWIAEHAAAGDIVITDDIPLADRAVKRGAYVLTPRGRLLTEDSICDALATRDLLAGLRESGAISGGGPKPFADRDRSTFLSRLDETVNAARRGARK